MGISGCVDHPIADGVAIEQLTDAATLAKWYHEEGAGDTVTGNPKSVLRHLVNRPLRIRPTCPAKPWPSIASQRDCRLTSKRRTWALRTPRAEVEPCWNTVRRAHSTGRQSRSPIDLVLLRWPFIADEIHDVRNQFGGHNHHDLALGLKSRLVIANLLAFGLLVVVLGKLADSLFIPSGLVRLSLFID